MAYKTYDLHTVFWMLIKAGYEDAQAVDLARLVMAIGALNRDSGMTTVSDESFEITRPKAVPGHKLVIKLSNTDDIKVVIKAITQEEGMHYFKLMSVYNAVMLPTVVVASSNLKDKDAVNTNEELAPLVITDYYCRRVTSIALHHGFLMSEENEASNQLSFLVGVPSALSLTLHIPEDWNAVLKKNVINRYTSGFF